MKILLALFFCLGVAAPCFAEKDERGTIEYFVSNYSPDMLREFIQGYAQGTSMICSFEGHNIKDTCARIENWRCSNLPEVINIVHEIAAKDRYKNIHMADVLFIATYSCPFGKMDHEWIYARLKAFTPNMFDAVVTKIINGDTLAVRTADNGDIEIRLYGIDAPEKDQPGGAEAAAYLKPLLKSVVSIQKKNIDGPNRQMRAFVSRPDAPGAAINIKLVDEGLAWFDERNCSDQITCYILKSSEAKARQDQRGIWSGEPVPPWEWPTPPPNNQPS